MKGFCPLLPIMLAAILLILPLPSGGGEGEEVTKAEYAGLFIVKVRVEGNRKIEAGAILKNVRSLAGEPLNPEKVAEDIKDIYRMGYFSEVEAGYSLEGEGNAELIFRVREKPIIRQIILKGCRKIDKKDLQELLTIKEFNFYDEEAIRESAGKIKSHYIEKGYFLIRVDYEVKELKGGDLSLLFRIDEGNKVTVKKILINGNREFSDQKLKRVLQTGEHHIFSWLTQSGIYQEEAVKNDVMILMAFYLDYGFINVKVDDPLIYMTPEGNGIHIIYNIREGEKYRIGALDISGDLIAERGKLLSLIRTKRGEYFARSKLAMDITRLQERYSDEGYAFANVVPLTAVNEEEKTVDLRFHIEKGKKVRVGKVIITGNTLTFDKVIRREINQNEGEIFKGSEVKNSKMRLERLGFFEEVKITTPKAEEEDTLDMLVEVKEKPTGTFNVGAGFSSIEYFMFNASVSKNNFLGLGYIMNSLLAVSSKSQQISFGFYDPYFLDSRWTASLNGYLLERQYYLNEFQRGGNISFGRYLDENNDTRLALKYTFQEVGIKGITEYLENLYGGELYRNGITSSISTIFTWDERNNRIFPTKGWYTSFSLEFAGGFGAGGDDVVSVMGGDFNFFRSQFNIRFYYPFIRELFVVKFNTTLGFMKSLDRTIIPYIERYRAGGINSLRGFEPYSLGPYIRYLGTDDPMAEDREITIGGEQLWVTNLELEFPIIPPAGIKGVIFLDMGNAFYGIENPHGVNFEESRESTGFGIRWFSPIGPLRFEWGFPLDRLEGEDPHVFEFGMGSFF